MSAIEHPLAPEGAEEPEVLHAPAVDDQNGGREVRVSIENGPPKPRHVLKPMSSSRSRAKIPDAGNGSTQTTRKVGLGDLAPPPKSGGALSRIPKKKPDAGDGQSAGRLPEDDIASLRERFQMQEQLVVEMRNRLNALDERTAPAAGPDGNGHLDVDPLPQTLTLETGLAETVHAQSVEEDVPAQRKDDLRPAHPGQARKKTLLERWGLRNEMPEQQNISVRVKMEEAGEMGPEELLPFLRDWERARRRELEAGVRESLCAALIACTQHSESFQSVDIALASMQGGVGGKGVCERLSERLKASFDREPEREVELVSGGKRLESLEERVLTQLRFRHELARAMRTQDDDAVVLAFLSAEAPLGRARAAGMDLYDVGAFVGKYQSIADWAQRVALQERAGVQALVAELRGDPNTLRRRTLIASSPLSADDGEGKAGTHHHRGLALVETREQFLAAFRSADEGRVTREEAAAGLKRLLASEEGAEVYRALRGALEAAQREVRQQHGVKWAWGAGQHSESEHRRRGEVAEADASARDAIEAGSSVDVEPKPFNVYALLAGWEPGSKESLKGFVSQWLGNWIRVPLADNGKGWVAALLPARMDEEVAGVRARVGGLSCSEELLLFGRAQLQVERIVHDDRRGSPSARSARRLSSQREGLLSRRTSSHREDLLASTPSGSPQAAQSRSSHLPPLAAATSVSALRRLGSKSQLKLPSPDSPSMPSSPPGVPPPSPMRLTEQLQRGLQGQSVMMIAGAFFGGPERDGGGGGKEQGRWGYMGRYQAVVTTDGRLLVDSSTAKGSEVDVMLGRRPSTVAVEDEPGAEEELGRLERVDRLKQDFIVQAACGTEHLLALTADGTVHAFGWSLKGQLGVRSSTQQAAWNMVTFASSVSLPLGAKVVQVACGAEHSMAVVDNGMVFAFGSNRSGQLGIGSYEDAKQPTLVTSYQQLAPTAKVGLNGGYSGSWLETEAAELPWVVQVACGAEHTVLLAGSGEVFVCGDNAWGQLGYWQRQDHSVQGSSGNDQTPGENGDEDEEEEEEEEEEETPPQGSGGAAWSVKAPLLLEGGHVPESVALAACGSSHTALLAHSGRLYLYGGVTRQEPTQLSADMAQTAPGSSNGPVPGSAREVVWVTQFPAEARRGAAAEKTTPVLYHGSPRRITHIECRGALTVATLAAQANSGHEPSGLVSVTGASAVWDGERGAEESFQYCTLWGVRGKPHVARLSYVLDLQEEAPDLDRSALSEAGPDAVGKVDGKVVGGLSVLTEVVGEGLSEEGGPGLEEPYTLRELAAHVRRELAVVEARPPNESTQGGYRRRDSALPSPMPTPTAGRRRSVQAEGGGEKVLKKSDLQAAAGLLRVCSVLLRLYAAGRSPSPQVRETAVRLWSTHQEGAGVQVEALPARNELHLGTLLERIPGGDSCKAQLLVCATLILYRSTQRGRSVSDKAVEALEEQGLKLLWRPFMLNDTRWNNPEQPQAPGAAGRVGFRLVEDSLLLKKLEEAGARNFQESDITNTALKELHPRADHAMLFLMRRQNVLNAVTARQGQLFSREYVVEIRTGDAPGAATDSNVFLEIVGTNGSSGERALKYSDKANAFERGQSDVFHLKCRELGAVRKVVVRSDGSAIKSSWYLEFVRVWQSGTEDHRYYFPFFGWMDAQVPGDVMRQELWHDPLNRDLVVYTVLVKTAEVKNAGTSAGVFVTIFGDSGDSRRQRLLETQSGSTLRLFAKGHVSEFRVPVAQDLGELRRLVVGHTGWGRHTAWLPERVEITKMTYKSEGAEGERDHKTYRFNNMDKEWIGDGHRPELSLHPDPQVKMVKKGMTPPPDTTPHDGTFDGHLDLIFSHSGEKQETPARIRFTLWADGPGRPSCSEWLRDPNSDPLVDDQVEVIRLGRARTAGEEQDPLVTLPPPDAAWGQTFEVVGTTRVRLGHPGLYRIKALSIVNKFSGLMQHSDVARSGDYEVVPRATHCWYRVHVFTGDLPGAGTAARVTLMLQGDDGRCTHAHPLDASHCRTARLANRFSRNREDVFTFSALDVGSVAQVRLWHDNSGLQSPDWFLHRVEVAILRGHEGTVKPADWEEGAPFMGGVLAGERERRVFIWRRWLTCKDAEGTQALLAYRDLAPLEPIALRYQIRLSFLLTPGSVWARLAGRPSRVESPVGAIVLFTQRFKGGATISVPPRKELAVQVAGGQVVIKFTAELLHNLGPVRGAVLLEPDGLTPYSAVQGLRLGVSCLERSRFVALELEPLRVSAHLPKWVASSWSSVKTGCSPLGDVPPGSVFVVRNRLLVDEPTVVAQQQVGVSGDGAGLEVDSMSRDSKRSVGKLVVETLEMISHGNDFDEEEKLQSMVPSCARLALLELARLGALHDAHLTKLAIAMDQESFPISLEAEIETHASVMLVDHLVARFPMWRAIPRASFELQQVTPYNKFVWNLLYWLCSTSPPDPEAIAYVLDNSAFERVGQGGELLQVYGVERDFALLLHFIVLRQIAKHDLLPHEAAAPTSEEAAGDDGRYMQLRGGWVLVVRAAFFLPLFLSSLFHVFLNSLLATALRTCIVLAGDWLKFRRFEGSYAEGRDRTKEEVQALAKDWRRACLGNYMWLCRRTPIRLEERVLRDKRRELVGPRTDMIMQWRREFLQAWTPLFNKVVGDWVAWFYTGTGKEEVAGGDEGEGSEVRGSSWVKREKVLDQLCRFKVVHQHRNRHARAYSLRKATLSVLFLLVLIISLFNMLGLHPLKDRSVELTRELREGLVEEDFDDSHNTFLLIANWENWWDWMDNLLVPYLAAPTTFQGSLHTPDISIAPVSIRQARVVNETGRLPPWAWKHEEKGPLDVPMCDPMWQQRRNLSDSVLLHINKACQFKPPAAPSADLIGQAAGLLYGEMWNAFRDSGYVLTLFPEQTGHRYETSDELAMDEASMAEVVEAIKDGGWFDSSTRVVVVDMMVYSHSRNRMAHVALATQFLTTGIAIPQLDVVAFKPTRTLTPWHFVYFLVFVYACGTEALQVFSVQPRRYLGSATNLANLTIAVMILALLATQFSIIVNLNSKAHFSRAEPWGSMWADGEYGGVLDLLFAVKCQKILAAWILLLVVLRGIDLLATFPVSGPIVYGIVELFKQPTILVFLACYSFIFFAFSLSFFVLGTDTSLADFAQVISVFTTMVRAGLSGDFDYESFTSHTLGTDVGPITFFIFIIFSQIIMTNLLIAIVSSEYDKAAQTGEQKWERDVGDVMARDLVASLPRDSSGQIDLHSTTMLVGHQIDAA